MTCKEDGMHGYRGFRLATVLRRSVPTGIVRLGLKSVLGAVLACRRDSAIGGGARSAAAS